MQIQFMSDHHAPKITAPSCFCEGGAGNQRQSKTASEKALLMAGCVSFLLALVTVVGFLIYQNHAARQSVQKSIFIGEARVRDLGIVLSEITHPDGHVEVRDESLLTDRNGPFVFVEDFDLKHRFIRTAVTAVPLGNGRSRIVHGLFPGDKMVVNGAARLRWETNVTLRFPETNCT
jgi:hypothetical protein